MPLLSPLRLTPLLLATTALCAAGAVPAAAQTPGPTAFTSLSGTVNLNGNARGNPQVGGPITGATVAPDGTFSGRLSLGRTTASPVVGGWLFANMRMEFDADAPITGTSKDGVLTATAKVTVRFPRVDYLGFQVGSGPNCRTREPATLTLSRISPPSNPAAGVVTGTIPFGPIVGCGPFTNVVQWLLSSQRHTFTGYLEN